MRNITSTGFKAQTNVCPLRVYQMPSSQLHPLLLQLCSDLEQPEEGEFFPPRWAAALAEQLWGWNLSPAEPLVCRGVELPGQIVTANTHTHTCGRDEKMWEISRCLLVRPLGNHAGIHLESRRNIRIKREWKSDSLIAEMHQLILWYQKTKLQDVSANTTHRDFWVWNCSREHTQDGQNAPTNQCEAASWVLAVLHCHLVVM